MVTSVYVTDPMFLTRAPWPIDVCVNWPSYLCKKCWGMKFYYNTRMAQCYYCGHIILNWGCKDVSTGDLAIH